MATTITINGKVRETAGKGVARKLRAQKRVPAVVYGKTMDPISLELETREFLRALGGHSSSNVIVELKLDGGPGGAMKTLIRDIQLDPMDGSVLHVDLNQISLTEMIEIEVPLEIIGVPTGVKNSGGILQTPRRAFPLRCLPTNIPESIPVDVTALEIGDAIHISDLDVADVEFMVEPEITVVSVVPPTKLEEPTTEDGEETPTEPEIVGEKKDDEDGDGDGGEGKGKGKDKSE